MSELVKHIILDSGIHKFIWLDNSQEAVHWYLQVFNTFIQEIKSKPADTHTKLHCLLDFRQTSFPSFDKAVSKTIDLRRQNMTTIDKFECRIAYLSDEQDFISQVNQLSNIMPSNFKRSFFKPDEEDQAIAWLILDE